MSGKKTPQIIGIGEVVFDILPDSRKLGGAPADFLHYAVKNGADGHLISAIGADDLGREVISELHKFGINPVLAVTPYPTGRVLIFNSPAGSTAHILENAAWDYIPFTAAAESCIQKADAVYYDTLAMRKSYSRTTLIDLIDSAPEKAYKFFDINLRQSYYDKGLIVSLLERANILKLNTEELKKLKTLLKFSENGEELCLKIKEKYNLAYLLLSDTTKESRIWGIDNELTSVKNTRLRQAFAFGAGNAFAGTFMGAILNGASQQEAHHKANDAAAEICRFARGLQP